MQLPIEIDELKEAFTYYCENSECIYYLDTTTGKIILDNGSGDPMNIDGNFLYLDGYSIEEFPNKKRFIRLPSNKSCDEYYELQAFIIEIESQWLRNKIENTIDSYQAFQRFQKILQREASEYEWSNFRTKQLEKLVLKWLESTEIETQG
ncbi:MAG: hypothetical protein KI793_27735 [Rivularia sp. (in: Bacteria)]|nr:hypothetical protein [Rivularia sp. MS3]